MAGVGSRGWTAIGLVIAVVVLSMLFRSHTLELNLDRQVERDLPGLTLQPGVHNGDQEPPEPPVLLP